MSHSNEGKLSNNYKTIWMKLTVLNERSQIQKSSSSKIPFMLVTIIDQTTVLCFIRIAVILDGRE